LEDQAKTDVEGILGFYGEAKVTFDLPSLQDPEDAQGSDVLTRQGENDGPIAAFNKETDAEEDGTPEESAKPDKHKVDDRP